MRNESKLGNCVATVVVVMLLSGCMRNHVIYAHRTVGGLDASVVTEPPSGRVTFGYDRHTVAHVPKVESNAFAVGNPASGKAMSVISCTEIATGLTGTTGRVDVRYAETLATGTAATNYATAFASNPAESPFSCFRHNTPEGE